MTRDDLLHLIDGTGGKTRVIAFALKAVIVASAIVLVVETVPEVQARLGTALHAAEIVFVTIFALEYFIRIGCAPNRWRYVFSFWGIVDLLAWLPSILALAPGLYALRILRLVRLIRLLRLERMRLAFDRIELALHDTKDELLLFSVLAALMLYLSAVGIYFFENPAQPEVFTSIPHSFWWAIATFTTVGYGDMVPITIGGRIFSTLVLIIGLGIVAVPVGIVTTALLTADEKLRKPHKQDKPTADGDR